MTANARSIEHALRKMLSHPSKEVREIRKEFKQVTQEKLPSLVKYAQANSYLINANKEAPVLTREIFPENGNDHDWCQLIDHDRKFETRIMAAFMYKYSLIPFMTIFGKMELINADQKKKIINILFSNFEDHDIPLRELEHSFFIFDCQVDQGAYFELKRHRMTTQTAQRLSTHLGFAVPRLISRSGLESKYVQQMEKVIKVYQQLEEFNPDVASYVVPNAFNRRVLLSLNLRAVLHIIKLRNAANAHFAIRRLACRLAEKISKRSSIFKEFITSVNNETWQSIEENYFSQIS